MKGNWRKALNQRIQESRKYIREANEEQYEADKKRYAEIRKKLRDAEREKEEAEKQKKEQNEQLKKNYEQAAVDTARISKTNTEQEARKNTELASSKNTTSYSQRAAETSVQKPKKTTKSEVPSWASWEQIARDVQQKEKKQREQLNDVLSAPLRLAKGNLTPTMYQTNRGLVFKSPYEMHQSAIDYSNDFAKELPETKEITKIDSRLSDINDQLQTLARYGQSNPNGQARQAELQAEQNSLNQKKNELTDYVNTQRDTLLKAIDPYNQLAETFLLNLDGSQISNKAEQYRQEFQLARDNFEKAKDAYEKWKKNPGVTGEQYNQTKSKQQQLLSQLATDELAKRSRFEKVLGKIGNLDNWISVHGIPSDVNLIPKNVRTLMEDVLPGSTTKEGLEQLRYNSAASLDLAYEKAQQLLAQQKEEKESGGTNVEVSYDQIDELIGDVEHRKSVASYAANGVDIFDNEIEPDLLIGEAYYAAKGAAVRKAKAIDPSYKYYDRILKTLNDAKRYEQLSKDAEKGNWYNINPFDDTENTIKMGMRETMRKTDFWDMGISGMMNAFDLKEISNKQARGEKLSYGEQAYLDALAIDNIMLQNHGQFQNAGGFKAGEVTTTSAKFMLDFILSKSALSALGELTKTTAKTGAKAAVNKATKFVLGQTGENMMAKAAAEAAEKYGVYGAKAQAMKYLSQIPGFVNKATGDATYSFLLTNTLQAPNTIKQSLENRIGNIDYAVDEDGNIQGTGFKNGASWLDAIYKAEASGFVENYSEMMGEWGLGTFLGKAGLGSVYNTIAKATGKGGNLAFARFLKSPADILKSNKIIGNLEKYLIDRPLGNHRNEIFKFLSDGSKIVADYAKKGQYHGVVGEIAEEYYGKILGHAMGVAETDKSLWEDLTDKQGFADIACGILLTSAFLGTASVLDLGRAQANKAIYENKAKKLYGDEWEEIKQTINLASGENFGEVVDKLIRSEVNEDKKNAIKNYAGALSVYRGASIREAKEWEKYNKRSHAAAKNTAKLNGYLENDVTRKKDLSRVAERMKADLTDQLGDYLSTGDIESSIEEAGGVDNFLNYLPEDTRNSYRNAVYAFDDVLSAIEGMQARYYDDVKTINIQSDHHIDRLTHTTGKMLHASTKENGNVFIVDGNVKYDSITGEIDLKNSDKTVKVRDINENTKVINTEDIQKITAKNAGLEKLSQRSRIQSIANARMKQLTEEFNITKGATTDLVDGSKLTILGTSRDGGLLYSIEKDDTKTIKHAKNVAEMKSIIDNIENDRVVEIIKNVVNQAATEESETIAPDLDQIVAENEQMLDQMIEQQNIENNTKNAGEYIPSINNNGKHIRSSKAFEKVKQAARKVNNSTTFEQFKEILKQYGVNVEFKYDARLKKLFNAYKKGNITAVQLAKVFVRNDVRSNINYQDIDVNNLYIDDEGNIIKPRQRKQYTTPTTTITEKQVEQTIQPETENEEEVAETSTEEITQDENVVLQPESNDQGAAEVTNEVIHPNVQNDAWNQLMDHLNMMKENVKIELRTGHDYFIMIGGKLKMVTRVHGILPEGWTRPRQVVDAQRKYKNQLTEAWNKGFDEFTKVAKSFNNSDMDIYLDYVKDNKEEWQEVIESMSYVLSSTKPGISVDYGNVLDSMCRKFLNDTSSLKYEDYNSVMAYSTFLQIQAYLWDLKDTYDYMGWKISTDPHVFYGEFIDSTTGKIIKVAGETDAIAVDRDGKYHIIDFKTSYRDYQDQYNKAGDIYNELWAGDKPSERIMSRNGAVRVMSQGTQYSMQLTMYKLMIEQSLGEEVASLELVPWRLRYNSNNPSVWLEAASNGPQRIPLQSNKDILSRYVETSSIEQSQMDRLQSQIDYLKSIIQDLVDSIEQNTDDITQGTKFLLKQIQESALQLQDLIGKTISSDIPSLLRQIQFNVDQCSYLEYLINQDIQSAAQMRLEQQEFEANNIVTPETLNEDTEATNEQKAAQQESVVETSESTDLEEDYDPSSWKNRTIIYKASNGTSVGIEDAYAEGHEGEEEYKLSRVTTNPDFITNAVFELVSNKVITADNKTKEVLQLKITYNGHTYQPTTIATAHNEEGKRFYGRAMAAIRYAISQGKRVLVNKVMRSNGRIIPTTPRSMQDSGLISMQKNQVGFYIYDVEYTENQDIFGTTVTRNMQGHKITQARCPGHILHTYNENNPDTNMPAGSFVMMITRQYDELQEGQRSRVPVAMMPTKITDGDANLILGILSGEYGRLDDIHKEGNISMGLTNRDILNMFIPTNIDPNDKHAPLRLELTESGDPMKGDYKITNIKIVGNIQGVPGTEHELMLLNDAQISDSKAFLIANIRRNLDFATAALRLGYIGIPGYVESNSMLGRLSRMRQIIEQKGKIKFGDSTIVFEKSDFQDPSNADDNRGLSGLGWYIKHGFIETPFNGFENALLSIDEKADLEITDKPTPTITIPKETPTPIDESKTANAKTQAELESEQKAVERRIEEINQMSNDMDNILNDLADLGIDKRTTLTSNGKPIDETTAREHLIQLFGENGVEIKWFNSFLALLGNDTAVIGRCYADAILLSRLAEEGVEWHEAFHRVVELLLTEEERKKVYSAYKNSILHLNRRKMTDQEVAEALADQFMYFMQNRPTIKLSWNIKKMFRDINDWTKMLLNIGSIRLCKLMVQTASGRFRNVKPTEEAKQRFKKFAKNGLNYSVNGVEFEHLLNGTQLKDLVDGIVFALINEETQDISVDKITDIKTNVETFKNSPAYKKWMARFDENHPTRKILEEAVKNYDAILPYVLTQISQFATDFKEVQQEENDDAKEGRGENINDGDTDLTSEEEMGQVGMGIENHTKDSYEASQFSRTTQKVRFFFAGIPTGTVNNLGLDTLENVKSLFNIALNELYECDSLGELIKKSAKLGKEGQYFFAVFANRLLKLYTQAYEQDPNTKQVALKDADKESLLIEITKSLRANKNSFKLVKDVKVGELHTHVVEDTSQEHFAKQYLEDWSEQFAAGSSKYVKTDSEGNITMKGNYKPNIFQKLYEFIAGTPQYVEYERRRGNTKAQIGLMYLFTDKGMQDKTAKINGRTIDVNNPKDLLWCKTKFVAFLNSLGIQFSLDALDYMLLHKYGSIGVNGMRQLLIPTTEEDKKSNIESFAQFLNGFYINSTNTLNLDKTGTQLNGVSIDKIFTKTGCGFIRELANWKYKYQHSKDQLMVLGTNNNRNYLISQNNTITDRLRKLQKNSEFLSKMKSILYNFIVDQNIGSYLLKTLSGTTSVKFQFVTNAGFKTDQYGDYGIDYGQLNAREDYISKMAVLHGGNLLFGTMSDKKTHGWIEGTIKIGGRTIQFKLPGINWDSPMTINDILPGGNMISTPTGMKVLPINQEVVDQLIEYAITEHAQVQKTLSDLRNKRISKDKQIVNYHTKEQGCRYTGLIGVYDINTGEYIDFTNNTMTPEQCVQLAEEHFFKKSLEEQRIMIQTALTHSLIDEMKLVCDLGLIEKVGTDANDPLAIYKNVGLDGVKVERARQLLYQKFGDNQYAERMAVAIVVMDALYRQVMSMNEIERVFSGCPSFFKMKWNKLGQLIDRTTDQLKRLGGLGSTGDNNATWIPGMPKTYKCAEINNEMITSPQYELVGNLMREGAIKSAYIQQLADERGISFDSDSKQLQELEELVDQVDSTPIEEIEAKLDPIVLDIVKQSVEHKSKQLLKDKSQKLDGIDVADGAAYITDVMCERLLRQNGKYGKEIQRAFRILRGEKINPSTNKPYTVNDTFVLSEAYKLIQTTVIGTQKYSAFGYRFQDGLAVPYYNKMALFPMFKNVCTGNMAKIYKAAIDQNVDMIMINSAVKVGSQGSTDIIWEDYDQDGKPDFNDPVNGFKFKPYEQSFEDLRKQFNTDPKDEKEWMHIGTQMLKVALSVLKPGRTRMVRGRKVSDTELRNDIMYNQHKLAKIGEQEVRDMFSDKDGNFDVEKFSKLLTEELQSRGASSQMLSAVSVVERNGKKELRVPLCALSQMNWIQSIINSIINKRVIDVNTPGAAYFQRSVWAMEGRSQVLGDDDLPSSLNRGNKLQMINEEGSMDCVLSIDFFYDILKRAGMLNKSLDEQKEWLMDHNIIGPNATANIIGYRIPTQAVSSIHALRCVDVIPTVRHTIILPAEFTKITGSDKQYRCSNQYNIKNPFNCWELLNQLRQSAAKTLLYTLYKVRFND